MPRQGGLKRWSMIDASHQSQRGPDILGGSGSDLMASGPIEGDGRRGEGLIRNAPLRHQYSPFRG